MGDGPGAEPVRRVAARPDDVAAVLVEAVTAAFGAASLAAEIVLRALSDAAPGAGADGRRWLTAAEAVETVFGACWWATGVAGQVASRTARAVEPAASLLLNPPLVPHPVRPAAVLSRLRSGWVAERPRTVRALSTWTATATPLATEIATSLVDVERVAGVALARVDVTALVTDVVDRVDVDRLLARAVDGIDLQALVEQVLARLDLDELVRAVLDRLALQPLSHDVVDRLDVAGLASAALDQIDLTQLVLDRVDLERIVTAALDSLDLTELVLGRVDLDRIVTSALDGLDLTQLVMQRVDLPRVADYVVDEIDLPEIIRESTGSMASETVQGVRLQGIEADRAVNRVVDRMLWRRRARHTEAVDLDGDDRE